MMGRVVNSDQPGTGAGVPEQRTPVAAFDSTGTIRIGRDEDNDIVLRDFWVSRRHAEIRRIGGEHHLVDLGSSNGLHHNGRRVPRAVLAPGDRFTIGRHEFLFDGVHFYQHDDMGPTSIIADDLSVQIGKNVLLDDVSFALRQGTLLGIIGPSGCGKSTLLKAMTGFRPATQGNLLYAGKDLYENYSELRYRIGMVPQDDVLHRQLKVRRALRFAASLRFADDVPRKQRSTRVNEVLELLGLTARAKQRIDTLSGGQRKRTSVALELLTEPSLLALDEPTSGLDPALDKEVMRELRLLADRGRTVVVVTHSVLHLELCDHVLVMCLGGRMGYFGPPDLLLEFFEAEDYADVFHKVTNDPARWAQRYRNSEIYRRYVGEVALELSRANDGPMGPIEMPTPRVVERAAAEAMAAANDAVDAANEAVAAAAQFAAIEQAAAGISTVATTGDPYPGGAGAMTEPAPPSQTGPSQAGPSQAGPGTAGGGGHPIFSDTRTPKSKPASTAQSRVQELSMRERAKHPVAPVRQFFTLCLRMLSVIVADRGYAIFLIGLPLALGLLSHTVPGSEGLGPDPEGYSLEAQRRLVVLVVGAAFMGIAVAIREIVNEQSIYRRERAIGLSPTAYLASKLAVFVVIDTIQVVLFVYIALLGLPGPADEIIFKSAMVDLIIPVALVAIASTALGLFASALVRTTEQTTPILVVSVMTQLVLSGGLFEINGQTALEIASWVDPSRWGFAAAAAVTDLQRFPFMDPLWLHEPKNWWRGVIILIVQIAVLVAGTRLALRRFEPGRD
jgi:ABC-type multidrug transport system ATPase subunit